MKTIQKLSLVALFLFTAFVCSAESRVLVFTRNGPTLDGKKGFVHDNIANNVAAIQKLGKENGFGVDVSEEASVFTDDNLKKYKALVFANSNNRAFDTEDQKASFQRYIRAGGGFVAIHSASANERAWPWYWALVGGTFHFHAPQQKFTVNIVDKNHPATSCFTGDTVAWDDEFYVMKEQPKNIRVLLAGNIKPLKMDKNARKIADKLPDSIPLAWCHEFEGGRAFYTALGHQKEHYLDPIFQKHILGGILWAMGETKEKK